MNDLELLRELGDETRLPELRELSAARARLVAVLESRPAAAGRAWRGPAARIIIGGVSVAAAAVVGVLVMAPPHGATPPGTTISARLAAKEVLDRAAAAALSEPAVTPQPGQFVYTKVDGGTSAGSVTQSWLSVDGQRNGLGIVTGGVASEDGSSVILGCPNGHRTIQTPGVNGQPLSAAAAQRAKRLHLKVPMDGPVETDPCTATPAYFPDMPTTASAMLPYLERTQGVRPGDLNDLAKTVGSVLEAYYILPAQRAALYQLLATTPGLTVVHNVHDVAGRPGVGVQWPFMSSEGGMGGMLIFNPQSFTFLGFTTVGAQGKAGGDALLQTAIVNQAGQVP